MSTYHLKVHSLTGNTDHDVTGLASGQILYVQDPTAGVQSTGISTDGSGGLTATTMSAVTFSAGTINSGSTNLYNIFATQAQAGNFIPLSGTNGNPVTGDIEISDDINISWNAGADTLQYNSTSTNVELTTSNGFDVVTGGILSAGTNLYNIFLPAALSGTSGNLWSSSTGTNSIIANNGTGNLASGSYSIVGGVNNTVSGNQSFIGGGYQNNISSQLSVIAGGYQNIASGNISTLVGGYQNVASGNTSALVGGYRNTAGGEHSFAGAGKINKALGSKSSIVGGEYNIASGINSFIGGGNQNSAITIHSSVVNGKGNITSGFYSFIGNGYNNSVNSNHAVIVGGYRNITNDAYTFIGTGYKNSATTAYATIVGGKSNSINIGTYQGYAFIGAGKLNTVTGKYGIVVGGSNNTASGGYWSTTVGGYKNMNAGAMSFIGGGVSNTAATGSYYATIVAGKGNYASQQGTIVAGNFNTASGQASAIVGGTNNTTSGQLSIVVGGDSNRATYTFSIVGGGLQNSAVTKYSVVVGGKRNIASGLYSSVLNGSGNTASGTMAFIGNGSGNTANGSMSFVGGGNQNSASQTNSAVAGGRYNTASGTYSFVGAGGSNIASATYSAIVGGQNNQATAAHASVVGGLFNVASGIQSFVSNGDSNTASGRASAVLAGTGHTASGRNTVVIGGGSITGSVDDTVYMPNARLAETPGSVIYSAGTPLQSIFSVAGSGVQAVGQGSNITTGGTVNYPVISTVASPSFNGLSVSGTANFTGALQSGSTDLANIFVQGSGTNGTLPLWTGTKLLSNSLLTQSGTGVTVNGSVYIYGNVDVLGTATTFNTQTIQSADNNITLNMSGSYVTAYGGGITVLSGNSNGASSTWTIDANGNWSANTGIITSALTVNNGNINVTGGGAIQSGGTDLYSIFATSGQDLTTASNGLTKSGYNITLGGTLTGNTTINGGSNTLNITSLDVTNNNTIGAGDGITELNIAQGFTYLMDETTNGSVYIGAGPQGNQNRTYLNALDGDIRMVAGVGGGLSRFAVYSTGQTVANNGTNNRLIIVDAAAKGLVYNANYSANFTLESLVTKRYVDTSITGVTSGMVQSVLPGSNITTGGTATNPTINLVASPSVNNFTASGITSLQTTSGTTIQAMQFFRMIPYTDSNPASPSDNDLWMHSAATGVITWNYRIGGATKTVELA